MPKNSLYIQLMSLDDFMKDAKAMPLGASPNSKHSRQFEIWFNDQFVVFECGLSEEHAVRRTHERAVWNALDGLIAPMPSAAAMEAYPDLEERYCEVLESRHVTTV